MALRSLVAELQNTACLDSKISALRSFLNANHDDASERNADDIKQLIPPLVDTVRFPPDKYGDVRPSDEEFPESCRYARFICDLLRKLARLTKADADDQIALTCFPHYLRLVAQLQSDINPWCGKDSQDAADKTLEEILSACGFRNLTEALDAEERGIFKESLDLILPDIKCENWKDSCSGRSLFIYLVLHSSGDVLGEHLDTVLPFILTLTDDFVPQNSAIGIRCMNHVLNEVSPSELRLRGRAEVLHDALSKKLYTREPVIAKVLIPCVLQSLDCLEPDMMRKRGCGIPKHDGCFDTILSNFHLSSDAIIRRMYAEAIPLFISRMGIQSISHMKTICVVMEYALEISELSIVSSCAKATASLVDAAWPRMAHNAEKLLEFLIKALYSVENDQWRSRGASEKKKKGAADEIVHAIAKLAVVAKELVLETVNMLDEESELGLRKHAQSVKEKIKGLT